MRRIEISRLMDEYVDTEFFPTGGSAASADAVKGWVLANAAPVEKRSMPAKKKLALIAVLAAVLVVLVGAGVPTRVFQILGGTAIYQELPGERRLTCIEKSPVSLEDGRLWFIADGQRIDITDLIDEDTPYIYDGCDPEIGLVDYMIVGGTIDDYGWYEWTDAPWMGFGSGGGVNVERIYYIVDGVTYDAESFESRWGSMGPFGMDWTMVTQDRQWAVAAAKELEIPFVPSAAETDTTLPAP